LYPEAVVLTLPLVDTQKITLKKNLVSLSGNERNNEKGGRILIDDEQHSTEREIVIPLESWQLLWFRV
jgi:hypothetical protein